ncbi:conjugal transfer protein TraG [Sphingobium sp. Sx8-8]|uniref:conjugal transfer protein TraG n=1 Tax=Sphingobium sp. Sx8-8 TaxID=2933617 RepID=UPI001F5940AD|nr:conjugal transfer protein TraG [Sphingobium sp. Sx8-8]
MNATRILWGQITAVFGVTLAGIWAATQWTAHALGYQPELGEPWFSLGSWPVYPPPAFFWWWFAFDAYAPKTFETGALIAVSGAMAGIVIAIGMSVCRAREAKKAETYGSARWASEREVRRVKMLGDDGVILGHFADRYLRHDGPEHVLCFAPTRSGKGVGLVIPSLLTWPGSCIVHDIKGENWQLTSGFRSRHGRVLLFDPTDPASAAYNPLLEVRKGEWEVRDVQNVADVLVDPEGSLEKRNHWEKTSHALLVGAILHVLYAEEDKTLAGVAAFLSDPRRPIETTLRAMMTTPHLGEAGVHPVVASAARELLNKSENERSGVLSTAMSFLGLYRDPIVATVTRACDWRIADLVDGPAPVSLYLVVPPSDISRTKPLIRLILNQVGRRLTEELNPKGRPHRLLLMLDEFPALGRLDFFESALAFMAGYGIKGFLIAQSLNQIEKAYGQNNAILDNCHVRVAFATNDERTAKRISDALGTATEMRAMKNYAGHRLSPWLGHLMVSRTETARPLLTPGEIMQLSEDEEIVMAAGIPPIRADKARYFTDPRLTARLLPPPVPRQLDPARRPKDDWSTLVPVTAPPALPPDPVKSDEVAGKMKSGAAHIEEVESGDRTYAASDTANAGIRREPDLGEHEEIVPLEKAPAPDDAADDDAQDEDAVRAKRQADRTMGRNARNASLDPDDGIVL